MRKVTKQPNSLKGESMANLMRAICVKLVNEKACFSVILGVVTRVAIEQTDFGKATSFTFSDGSEMVIVGNDFKVIGVTE